MKSNISNFFNFKNNNSKIGDYQDLDHLDGLSISTVSANLYDIKRDDLVLFYFRRGANYASVFTQSKIVSENIKWNREIKNKKINALLVNTRNANAFTGKAGFQGLKEIADELSSQLTLKQKNDDDKPERIMPHTINGIANLYRLIPEAFIAVHSFRLTIEPKLKTVAINTAIGNPMLMK